MRNMRSPSADGAAASLLDSARMHVEELGVIPLDVAAQMIEQGWEVSKIEQRMQKELGL